MTTEREKESLAAKGEEGKAYQTSLKESRTQLDYNSLRKMKKALDHKKAVDQIRICLGELLEAQIRLIEAKSDKESLEEHNADIVQQLEQERELVRAVEQEAKVVHIRAKSALRVCKEILAEAEAEGNADHFRGINKELTVEDVETEIAAEESKLEYIHANNPNAIRDYEKRQAEVEKLKERVSEAEEKLGRLDRHITKVRGKWEPELDKLIEEISTAFSHNFQQIGCAGEVAVHKDDDFEQWAIQIRVKFRCVRQRIDNTFTKYDLQRERKPSTPRSTSSIRRRAIRLDDLLPHVVAISCKSTFPCCR